MKHEDTGDRRALIGERIPPSRAMVFSSTTPEQFAALEKRWPSAPTVVAHHALLKNPATLLVAVMQALGVGQVNLSVEEIDQAVKGGVRLDDFRGQLEIRNYPAVSVSPEAVPPPVNEVGDDLLERMAEHGVLLKKREDGWYFAYQPNHPGFAASVSDSDPRRAVERSIAGALKAKSK